MGEYAVMEDQNAVQDMSADQAQFNPVDLNDERLQKYEKMLEKAVAARKDQQERWRKDEQWFYNELPFTNSAQTQLHIPVPMAVHRTMMAVLSDHMPTFDIVAKNQKSMFFADMKQKRKREWERDTNFPDVLLEAASENLKYGNACVYLGEQYGIDDHFVGPDPANIDLYTVFMAPHATGMDYEHGEADYISFKTPYHIDEAKRYIKTLGLQYDYKYDWLDDLKGEGNLNEYRAFSETTENDTEGDYVLFNEIWLMDPDDDIKQYPHGRVTVWVGTGNSRHLIVTRPAEGNPYFWLKNNGSKKRLYGISETRLINTIVLSLNETLSGIADNIKKTGNPIMKVTKRLWNALKGRITGRPGEKIPVSKKDDFGYEPVPNLQAGAFTYIDTLMRLIDFSTGLHDVIQGKKPAGITAASAIAELAEAAQAGIRYKLNKDFKPVVIKMGKHVDRLFTEHDDQVRDIRARDQFGRAVFEKYDPVNSYMENDSGEMMQVPDGTLGGMSMRDSTTDVEVVTGVRMPMGRVATESWARQLMKDGIFTIEDYVPYSMIEDKEAFIKNWYRSKGIEQAAQEYDAEEKAVDTFQKISKALVNEQKKDPEKQIPRNIAIAEEELATLLRKHPRVLNSTEFQTLDDETQQRLLVTFWSDKKEMAA